MRGFFLSLVGTGFLLLIAFSWLTNESAPPHATDAAAPLSRSPASTPAESRAEIQRLSDCLERASCNTARGVVGEALAVALAEHFTNFGADGDLARAAVQSPEPIVQAVGLRMLASLPPSGENLSALGTGLRSATDAALAENAARELERYLGTPLETDAQRIVESLAGYGTLTASLVRPFINEHSYDEFKELLSRLDAGAAAARYLRSALSEYESHRRGG